MALLIEHYNGRWPFWLSPRQVTVLTVTNDPEVLAYANTIVQTLQLGKSKNNDKIATEARDLNTSTLAVELDDSSRPLKKKILEAKTKKFSAVVVIGKRNLENGGTANVDFSGMLDPAGLLQEHVNDALVETRYGGMIDGASVENKKHLDLKDVRMQVGALREVLERWEAAYQ